MKTDTLVLAKSARNRIWAIVLLHILSAPIGSLVYSAKQNNWLPFITATGVFIVGLPVAIIDFGLTAFLIAPFLSVFMLTGKVNESRRRLGVVLPEQADALVYKAMDEVRTDA
jgi:hypothetical protein